MISIIIPIYNVEDYLNKCIDSIIYQTYSDWELILVDDGSFDSSPAICDSYATCDSRIKVIHKINEGVSKARNIGIEIAQGEYIVFCDAVVWCTDIDDTSRFICDNDIFVVDDVI